MSNDEKQVAAYVLIKTSGRPDQALQELANAVRDRMGYAAVVHDAAGERVNPAS